jgi:FkbM family methyltransferase
MLTLQQKLHGKFYAAQVFAEFIRYFSNWREIWSAYKSGTALPELCLRSGLILIHAQDDVVLTIFREIFEEHSYTGDGFYRPKTTDVVLDIGANIGIFAVYLQSLARGINVHCFEPGSSARSRLQQNLSSNNLASSVFVYPFAVSDKNGVAHLGRHVHSVQRALVYEDETGHESEEVESITLARAIGLSGASRIDLLKIDIEGGETEVILGSPAELWKRVERVALEYHGSLRPGCREELTAALRDRGLGNIRCIPMRNDATQGILRASR